MITDFLLDHAAVVPVVLVLVALACGGVGALALRSGRHGQRALWALAALSVVPVLALTLVPSATSRLDSVGCTVQFALPTLGSVELLADVALFVPPVVFATLATRRPLGVLAAGTALSALIEAVQAFVPALGRACDTNDWAMNTTGAVLGVLLAAGTLALADRRRAAATG